MTRRHTIVCVLFLTILLGVARQAAAQCPALREYQQYFRENRCPNDNEDGCLEATSYIATRSDGRRVRVRGVYRWYDENAIWEDDGVSRVHMLPHFILGYMRVLLDAYDACPDLFRMQLFNQIDYVVSRGVMRHYPGLVIPARVWENRYGITQGMEQSEMAEYLAFAARVYSKHGAPEARGTMRYAFEAIQSLFIPVGEETGGVRSILTTRCGAKRARLRPCFWFHSRGVGIDTDFVENPGDPPEDRIATVLNQHLMVVHNILGMYKQVSRVPHLVPRELGGSAIALARLEDRAIGGLYQLAFSRGNNSAAPTRPPNLAQFMRHDTDVRWFPFYFSYYRLDLTDRTFRDISLAKTCHYHTHSLASMKNIKETLDTNVDLFANSPTLQGWRLYEAVDRLFAGFGEPMGIAESTNAIWQFWLAERSKYTPEVGCPRCTDKETGEEIPCPGDVEVTEYYRQIW